MKRTLIAEKKQLSESSNHMVKLLCAFLLLISMSSFGQLKLPRLIQDGMILQREAPVKIWGWASVGEKVTLQFNNQSFNTVTGDNGKWQITLPAQKAGGPFSMEIVASNRISLKDILFGDVWLCSGQSNMEYPMNRLTDKYADIIPRCENSNIRQFKVLQVYDFNAPKDDYPSGSWVAVTPKTILDYSAVAYFFARDLYEKYHVPIGIINASVGGSPAEAWMSADALKEFPNYLAEAKKFKNQSYINQIQTSERKASYDWYAKLNQTDKGLQSRPTWKDPAFDASSWPTMPVPSYWADHGLGKVNGVVWFRREFGVPASMIGKPVRLFMGRIVDADSVFINGKFVGTTSYQYPQRNYHVPAGVLQAGKNTVVVRVISNSGLGGFVKEKPYQLFNEKDTIKLAGSWQYQLGCIMPPTPGQTFVNWKPTGLYNGMLAPANNYAIKGAAWYQGESNAERFQEYQKLLTALIADWRLKHNQGYFPFIIAQLPNFMDAKDQPSESSWAWFRNAQLKTSQTVENIALTVNIDLGDWNDIHPQNKEDVGKRLALAAERLAYHDKKVVASGPIYQSLKIKGNKVELTFNNCGSGLVVKDGKALKQFAIAGADGKFIWAQAKIEGNKVVVWNEAISNPVSVRYAWADNPEGANLYNVEGLPASPFRTDQ
ncbi:MAG: beta galactosidase jelly roll domain-containing protein [Bacteroidia bacterium]|nr:beta galactosidase jelly roll domain-containing protein [Bacteroidia bacterium]